MSSMVNSVRISFVLNDAAVTAEVAPGMSALAWLREVRGLTGTKEGCGEGDCGACTVAIGESSDGKVVYRAFNACLLPAVKLHGRHIVTIEGLAAGGSLHPIQTAILEGHATQCGFCTPGIAMSLFCLFANDRAPDDGAIKTALEGNLCRCTGYESVLEAARAVRAADVVPAHLRDAAALLAGLPREIKTISRTCAPAEWCIDYHLPKSLAELFQILTTVGDCARYRIIGGGTDLMVGVNVFDRYYPHLVDISRIPDLRDIREEHGTVLLGALVTFADLVANPLVARALPALHEAAAQMGSTQIRNAATIAGNIGNASPIGDGGVTLLALGARLRLKTTGGDRTVPLEEFYLGYKKTCLQDHEVIAAIEVPAGGARTSVVKSAKRGAVDIATVNSAVALTLDGATIASARIAFGGVAPTPVLARAAMAALAGKRPAEALFREAGSIAAAEVSPITDVRGGAEYRRLLVRNQMVRHWERLFDEEA